MMKRLNIFYGLQMDFRPWYLLLVAHALGIVDRVLHPAIDSTCMLYFKNRQFFDRLDSWVYSIISSTLISLWQLRRWPAVQWFGAYLAHLFQFDPLVWKYHGLLLIWTCHSYLLQTCTVRWGLSGQPLSSALSPSQWSLSHLYWKGRLPLLLKTRFPFNRWACCIYTDTVVICEGNLNTAHTTKQMKFNRRHLLAIARRVQRSP